MPDEIVKWKNDEDLHPWAGGGVQGYVNKTPAKLWIGVGTYKTVQDGEIYLCTLIDPDTKKVESYSIGVYRSAELAGRALENLSLTHRRDQKRILILASRNPLYRTRLFQKILAEYAADVEMTRPGTRGGAATVSTFFSQLMRKKGTVHFQRWQDAVNWLESYIFEYNKEKQ